MCGVSAAGVEAAGAGSAVCSGSTNIAAREVNEKAHSRPITAGSVPARRSRVCLLRVVVVIILNRFLVNELRSPLAISGL